jgi:O-6-methylguanine DNA methyltransferase
VGAAAKEITGRAGLIGACATSWGYVVYLHDGARLAHLWYGDRSEDEALARARRLWPWAQGRDPLPGFEGDITAYFAGEPVDFTCVIRLDGVADFHRQVYEAARRIPYGHTISYGGLAAMAGSPKAARAVGQAMARNPIGIVIPCHRVIAADGGLGGFGPGLDVKRRLLELEGALVKPETEPRGSLR